MNTENTLNASAARMANGWAAIIEFPNGGRQRFSSRHGTMDAAILEARHGIKCRIEYPNCTVRDPNPHELMVLEELENRAWQNTLKTEYYLNEGPR
jgi:hypothetical protein